MPATLSEALEALDATRRGFHFRAREAECFVPFAAVREACAARAAQLRRAGYRPGDRLGLVLADQREFVITFLAALRAGVVAVPVYPPLVLGVQAASYLEHVERILAVAGARGVAVSPALRASLAPLGTFRELFTPQDLEALPADGGAGPLPGPDDVAFLQFTSGSTDAPKGVVVTHRRLVANAAAIIDGIKADGHADAGVSWLPMYHDMGLVGFLVVPLLIQASVTFFPTLEFARRPLRWLELLHETRATVSFAPNFAYALVARRAGEEELAKLDLSCWRVAGCGAEPIDAETLRRFGERLRPARLSPRALLPCYGMAEATLAVTFARWEQPWSSLAVDGDALASEGLARPVPPGSPGAREIVSCGAAVVGHEVRVVDLAGAPLPERVEGEIVVRGPSVAARYEGDTEATRRSFRGGWLWTGDLGFLHEGELYVTGRSKDVVILAGRNFHAHDVERCVACVDGVRPGAVAAFASRAAGAERLVAVAEVRRRADTAALQREAVRRVRAELGAALAELRCVPPGSLPVTSSGKLRRARARELYAAGAFDPKSEEPRE